MEPLKISEVWVWRTVKSTWSAFVILFWLKYIVYNLKYGIETKLCITQNHADLWKGQWAVAWGWLCPPLATPWLRHWLQSTYFYISSTCADDCFSNTPKLSASEFTARLITMTAVSPCFKWYWLAHCWRLINGYQHFNRLICAWQKAMFCWQALVISRAV